LLCFLGCAVQGFELRALVLDGQVFYQLSHVLVPSALVFEIGSLFSPGPASNLNLPTSTSQASGIIGMHCLAQGVFSLWFLWNT
jgi:hypothetical protein